MSPTIAAALVLALPTAAPPSSETAQAEATAPDASATAPSAFPTARRADAAALERSTAREDIAVVAESRQTASVASSSVNGTSLTGEATIAGQAFQNASGLTVVNINTGNNVAMNASMNVNVVINPLP
jgi:hypothetical protein